MKKVIFLLAFVVLFNIIGSLNNSSLAENEVIVFTELSSTQLTASGGHVTFIEPDHWHFSLGLGIAIGSNSWYWIEPENPNLGNRITGPTGSGGYYDIRSDYDVSLIFNGIGYADGTILSPEFIVEGPAGVFTTYDAQFFDKGDVGAAVPEPATMLLLGSGLIGLARYGRKKFFKK